MKWKKKGLIFVTEGRHSWAQTHAMIPTPEFINNNCLRFYVTVCDKQGIGRIGYVDVSANPLCKVIQVAESPILDIGDPGTFDENGILVTSIVNLPDGTKYLYYVGFEIGTKIRYRLLTGLAISRDNGKSFARMQKTPILERSDQELYFRGGPFVIYENGSFRMWYVGGNKWLTINGKEMPVYTINYLESNDGITWDKYGKVCIDIVNENEHGFGRPYIIKHDGKYKMFYSIRVKYLGYRLGYAESTDGINWIRKDQDIGINVSESGWDSEAVCYSAVIKINDQYYMFYNGNEFGKTGFGWAELVEW
ncbi:hypothetical protein [Sporomusa acidovorans]|uniref:Glycosyl hydrolases family 43 n=1 Tax=Sporomusa acidovorans (strain ATCC 49682 / DSM 3132 / Mol) TaxID=1123286 RepID=A0ABZ3J7N5_SPOA4|nr:hypothetical protein [Sporomusa acidovorans]OZC13779.1 glycosyl hydrolases family 43 [Sporomusa acidovorans DSM 3132]SDF87772.1 hypothetical protein SAMN04488499_11142 [Sporomusa acidovorans]